MFGLNWNMWILGLDFLDWNFWIELDYFGLAWLGFLDCIGVLDGLGLDFLDWNFWIEFYFWILGFFGLGCLD